MDHFWGRSLSLLGVSRSLEQRTEISPENTWVLLKQKEPEEPRTQTTKCAGQSCCYSLLSHGSLCQSRALEEAGSRGRESLFNVAAGGLTALIVAWTRNDVCLCRRFSSNQWSLWVQRWFFHLEKVEKAWNLWGKCPQCVYMWPSTQGNSLVKNVDNVYIIMTKT